MTEQQQQDLIRLLLADGPNWEAEENHITQLSEADLQVRLGFEPGPDELSLEEREQKAAANQANYRASMAVSYPSVYSWEAAGKCSPVRDQGQCGSCVAFSTSTTLATMGIINNLSFPGSPFIAKTLSPAYLFYCVAASQGRTCSNGWNKTKAVEACVDLGCPYELYFPYTAGDQPCTVVKPWNGIKAGNSATYTDVDDMRLAISTTGPLVTGFTVYSDFGSYKGGIYEPGPGATKKGGHSVSVVGYCAGGKLGAVELPAFWLCQNSWGKDWGLDGFFFIKAGVCGIDAEMLSMTNPTNVYGVS